jgi:hypothetical protein
LTAQAESGGTKCAPILSDFSKNSRLVKSFMSCSLLRWPESCAHKVALLLTLDEREQICIDLLLVPRAHTMRQARIFNVEPLISLDDSIAKAPMGTIWSSSPCMISVGTCW